MEYLAKVRLPSSPKALLPISSKTFPHVGRQGEDTATLLRGEAVDGNVHPYTVVKAWTDFRADAEAVRKQAEAVISDITDALAILDGSDLQPQGAFSRTAAEMAFVVDGLSKAASDLARSKAVGLREDTAVRLKAIKATALEDLDGAAHRIPAVQRKLGDALIAAVAKHQSVPLRFSLDDARDLLGPAWDFLPSDPRPLPAPCSSPYRKADDPRRLAAVFVELIASKEAAAVAAAEAAKVKLAKRVRKKSKAELIKDQLATLPRR